ncbi:hypothetical protein BASA50_001482 [Batrachochytrium salamandrivorans]|uniref:Uncharacterized protein n=1 Tax=Batrachochytrium salamandrivorans TaxID=1357716 RepID=A0ABQ8FPK2_9FUNG|nr:hypothetical protein BASA60_001405 [Batrachochytrium salamandrivorans]KAH6601624.1 hypothetical protein BASA50_001482 [Batrachochytrium salamandrivorans]KAH9269660.1 hypothetical protein BASA83_008320 [Batrachochytrium salamandrivorans]
MRHYRQINFGPDAPSVTISELDHPTYGCYTWPASVVLAALLFQSKSDYAGKRILELGAGTALVGLMMAKMGQAQSSEVVLTDHPLHEQVLQNIEHVIELNHLGRTAVVKPLAWGDFDGSIAQLLQCHTGGFDIIVGADLMYDPKDFEILLATVAMILQSSPPDAVFLMAYQERSSRRSMQWLLEKWGLSCRQVHYDMLTMMDWIESSMDLGQPVLPSDECDVTNVGCCNTSPSTKRQTDLLSGLGTTANAVPLQHLPTKHLLEAPKQLQSGLMSVLVFEIRATPALSPEL